MIEMRDVCKTFRTDSIETSALKDLNLQVAAGEFVAVTGPSGSGKTTFLNITGLLEELTSGSYQLGGREVSRLSDNERSRIRNTQIGFIFQNFNLIPTLSVYDNIDVPLRYQRLPSSERNKRISDALERVGLTTRRHHLPSQLSGGQQQRVAIARALAGRPQMILADEPTGNLDSVMSLQIMDLIEEVHAAGTTVVMVTHSDELAARAQRRIKVEDGRIVEEHARSPSATTPRVSPASTCVEGA